MNKEFQQNLSILETLIPEEKRDEAKKVFSALALLSGTRRELSAKRSDDDSIFQFAVPLIAGIASVLATSTLGSKFFSDGLTPVASALFSKVFPILGFALLVLLAMSVLLIALRIRRRGRKGSSEKGSSSEG